MIARFRPTYSFADLLSSLFDNQKAILKLKQDLSEAYGTSDIFFFSQARLGLFVLLKSLGKIGKVISPSYNSISISDTVRFSGMENAFADISLADYNMDPKSVEKVINKGAKILIATHQFGIPCDILRLQAIAQKNGLLLIEDAADALGAKVNGKLLGTFGMASIISFENSKVISGFKAGCLIVNDKRLAEKIEKIKVRSRSKTNLPAFLKTFAIKTLTKPYFYNLFFPLWTRILGNTQDEKSTKHNPYGYLAKISSFSASLVQRQINKLNDNVKRRDEIANIYLSGLSRIKTIKLPKIKSGILASWVRFPIRVKLKEDFFKKVASEGVDLTWTFSYCVDNTPNAIEAAKTVLGLPIYPSLTNQEVERVINVIKKI